MSEMNESDESNIVNLPKIWLKPHTTVAAPGSVIQIEVDVADEQLLVRSEIKLELISSNDEVIGSVPMKQRNIDFPIEPKIEFGDYELQAAFEKHILDSVPIRVTNASGAIEFEQFTQSVELRSKAFSLIESGEYEKALIFSFQASTLSKGIGRPDIAARGFKDIGAALLKAEQYEKASMVLQEANHIYEQQGNVEGMASSLHLLGRAAFERHRLDHARSLLERSCELAETVDLEMISLGSRELLWQLSDNYGEEMRRRYAYELLDSIVSLKSPTSRIHAIELCERVISSFQERQSPSFHLQKFISDQQCEATIHLTGFSNLERLFRERNVAFQPREYPWGTALEPFNAKLLSNFLVDLGDAVTTATPEDIMLRVMAQRSAEHEHFGVYFAHDQELQSKAFHIIGDWLSDDDDFKYYGRIANAMGASLKFQLSSLNQAFLHFHFPKLFR